jgi:hypothetical protein
MLGVERTGVQIRGQEKDLALLHDVNQLWPIWPIYWVKAALYPAVNRTGLAAENSLPCCQG